MGVVNRHRLQQELEELERNPLARRRVSIQEPAPPYCPRPPSYVEQPSSPPQTYAIDYAEIPTASPPGSPVMRRRSLEVLMPQALHAHDPRPNG
jgi:hypothetical protein